jgi:hypothetical protein
MGLLGLMNYMKNGRRFPKVTPENASKYYLFANEFTLNGVYLYQILRREGYDPIVVQNYALVRLSELLREEPLAVCISFTFLYLDDIKEIARRIKEAGPPIPVVGGVILAKKVLQRGEGLAPQTRQWLGGFSGKVDAFIIETHGEETLKHALDALGQDKDLGYVHTSASLTERERFFHGKAGRKNPGGQHRHSLEITSPGLSQENPLGHHHQGMLL